MAMKFFKAMVSDDAESTAQHNTKTGTTAGTTDMFQIYTVTDTYSMTTGNYSFLV